ncbi:hypothetical protein [Isoptericola rhizosphaerae]|uniref:hypothetical protein n=1 Tax=Isoptericola rhizosphaerae TaxID=3377837 RepID=UPI003839E720
MPRRVLASVVTAGASIIATDKASMRDREAVDGRATLTTLQGDRIDPDDHTLAACEVDDEEAEAQQEDV